MFPPPRKRFGQNFLQDPTIIEQILTAIAPQAGDRLVEIGPGRGAITQPLLRQAGRLDVVELDRDLIDPLRRACQGLGHLTIHQADALAFALCPLAGPNGKVRIVGNLPYNISTPLLFRFLEQKACIQDLHLMLQKEVVDRIVAPPGSKIYGRLSVMVQTWCQALALFDIPAQAFFPAPKVNSAFLRLLPLDPVPLTPCNPRHHAHLVALAFSQRRKTLRNSLKDLVSSADFSRLKIDPGQRAEDLPVSAFVALADVTCNTSSDDHESGKS